MKNVRAIYTSRMSEDVGEQQIQDILTVSRRNNKDYHLTGMLCFGARQFLQCLEGPRKEVNETYARIIADPRHKDVVLLSYRETGTREFGDWSMGYVPESAITVDLLARTMGQNGFSPLALNSNTAMDFLREVKQYVPAI